MIIIHDKQPKNLLPLIILEILKQYSDENHRLSQREIHKLLENKYEINIERKTLRTNLMNLVDFGLNIEYSENVRINKSGEEEFIHSNFYYVNEFSDSELRLLIDSILFSKHIPYKQCKELIQKIEELSSIYFKSKVKHVCNLQEDTPSNKEIFYNIDILNEAIEKNRQVAFNIADYGTDKELHPRKNNDGKIRTYIVNPYQMVATNGKYYLIGNYDKYDNISHYRLDKIYNISILESKSKPQRDVVGLEKGLNLPKHMAQHIYMFSGPTESIIFRAEKTIVNEIIDWFGNSVYFTDETENDVVAHVEVSTMAMKFWALQYCPYITVISPKKLADEIKDELEKAIERYL